MNILWDSMIRGHPVYGDILIPFVDEILCVEQEKLMMQKIICNCHCKS